MGKKIRQEILTESLYANRSICSCLLTIQTASDSTTNTSWSGISSCTNNWQVSWLKDPHPVITFPMLFTSVAIFLDDRTPFSQWRDRTGLTPVSLLTLVNQILLQSCIRSIWYSRRHQLPFLWNWYLYYHVACIFATFHPNPPQKLKNVVKCN